jgi:hypothetical protein
MTLIKIVIIYIVAYELWCWCSVKPIVKKWRKTETEDELFKNHETFLTLVGLGRVLEEIGIIAILIDVLFFIL